MVRIIFAIMFTLALNITRISAGTLTGKVQNGTAGSSLQSGLTVELERYRNEEIDPNFKLSTPVSKNGEYSFSDLEEDPAILYQPLVLYQNVKYYGQEVQFDGKNNKVQSNVFIFETTDSDSAVSALRHHILINPAKGVTFIREMIVLENRSDRTYVGKKQPSGDVNQTILYNLPEGAADLKINKGLMACCIINFEGGFYDTMELPPGRKEVVFSYHIDSPDSKLDITKPITLPTAALDVIPMTPDIGIESKDLKEASIGDTKLKRFAATGLYASPQTISFRVTGLAGQPFNWSYVILPAFLAILFIGGAIVFFRTKREQPVITPPQKEKVVKSEESYKNVELIKAIALLDEAFENKLIEESHYREKRKELKESLTKLYENQNQLSKQEI